MLKYIAQRVGLMLITLFLIIVFSFIIIHKTPGGVFNNPAIKPEIRAVMNAKYHLDKPIIIQFGYYIQNVAKLDFGVSLKVQPQRAVFDIIKEKFPITIQLNIFSTIVILPFAFFFGILAALKKNTVIDHGISIMVVLFISVPSFVFASLMQYVFAFKLGWFPIILSTDQSFGLQKFHSMILPILALSFGSIAAITRYLRAELSEALNSEYMLLAKTKGLTQVQAILRHALRNSFIPITGMLVGLIFDLLSGSWVIENIFGIPGIGRLTLQAISSSDYPLIIANIILYSAIGLMARLVIDLLYGVIDPRIRMGGGKNAK